jgi:hypothetical protein
MVGSSIAIYCQKGQENENKLVRSNSYIHVKGRVLLLT